MNPKTEIRYSFIYNRTFNPEISLEEFKKLKKDSQPLVKLFLKYKEAILESIAKHNEEWKRKYIPIYIVKAKIKSFSDPLTLKYRDNHELMFLVLIHELIHNNITKKFKDSKSIHFYLDKIFNQVIKELKLKGFEKVLKQYDMFR